MDITLVIARPITSNPCIIIKSIDNLFFIVIFIVKKKKRLFSRLCSLKFCFNGSSSGPLARSRSEFFMETKSNETQEIKKKVKSKYTQKFDFFLTLLCHLCKKKGLCRQRIIGPSWIWTSVDILPTNLQSVPINRSGIDPGRIYSNFMDNPWSTSFRSTLPPGEVESPLPPWKRDVLNH